MFKVVEMYEKEIMTGYKVDRSLDNTWMDLSRFFTKMDLNSFEVRRFLK